MPKFKDQIQYQIYFCQQFYSFLLFQMSIQNEMAIPQLYSLVTNKSNGGIEGYNFQKKYFDPLKQIQQRQFLKIKKGQKTNKHVTKRGNFLDDQANMYKSVPGPGKYTNELQWPQKSKFKIQYSDKKTYVDEIINKNKKEKGPAPGSYNVVKTMKEIQADKKKLASKKIHHQDRITYLDQVQYESNLSPGTGNYNPRERIKTQFSQLKTKPDDWRKKHQQMSKKKPPKSPDPTTYKPLPSQFLLFENLSKKKLNKNFLGRVERFKTEPSGSGLNPAKYNIIQQWRGKDKKNIIRHGVQSLSSKTVHKSPYYH